MLQWLWQLTLLGITKCPKAALWKGFVAVLITGKLSPAKAGITDLGEGMT